MCCPMLWVRPESAKAASGIFLQPMFPSKPVGLQIVRLADRSVRKSVCKASICKPSAFANRALANQSICQPIHSKTTRFANQSVCKPISLQIKRFANRLCLQTEIFANQSFVGKKRSGVLATSCLCVCQAPRRMMSRRQKSCSTLACRITIC